MEVRKEEIDWVRRLKGLGNTSKESPQELKSTTSVSNDVNEADRKGHGFAKIAGMKDVVKLFQEGFINILKNEECAKAYDLTPPGVLLFGPPGVGKTYVAKALGEELGINFMQVSPDTIASKWVHGSTEKINKLFAEAIKKSPTILFLDEFDSMVSARNDSKNNLNEEVNEFLCKLGSAAENGVYPVAATNHIELIDRAVLRTGRFDELVYIGMPDVEARREQFKINLEKLPSDSNIDYDRLASLTKGFSCSDLAYIVKASSRLAFNASIAEREKPYKLISQELLEEVIVQRHPSVSARDLQDYERIRDIFIPKSSGAKTQKIGFK